MILFLKHCSNHAENVKFETGSHNLLSHNFVQKKDSKQKFTFSSLTISA